MKPPVPYNRSAGFTLIEILVVLGIILLISAIALPMTTGMQNSTKLTQAASIIQDQLNLARQMSITLNQPVSLHLCKTPDELGGEAFNLIAITKLTKDGQQELLERPVRLPVAFAISENVTLSSLMNKRLTSVPLRPGVVCASLEIRFTPSGSTTLDPEAGHGWFLTVRQFNTATLRTSPDPGSNFITIAIDPTTGRISSYQP